MFTWLAHEPLPSSCNYPDSSSRGSPLLDHRRKEYYLFDAPVGPNNPRDVVHILDDHGAIVLGAIHSQSVQ